MTNRRPAGGDERLRELARRLQRNIHDAAVHASPMFSTAHWEHHAPDEWPHEPDDDSYLLFENCGHPDCVLVSQPAERPAPQSGHEYHEPPEGGRIVRIYSNGSWLEDSPAGQRKRYSLATERPDAPFSPSQ